MVNREQEVIDRVQMENVVITEPLREMFSIEPFEDSMLRGTEHVFDIDTVGHHTQATASGSLLTPVDEQESFDLFSKLAGRRVYGRPGSDERATSRLGAWPGR